MVGSEDLLSSTPRQLAVYRAMGVARPNSRYSRTCPTCSAGRPSLGKRNGVAAVNWYREEALPEAMDGFTWPCWAMRRGNRESFRWPDDGRVRPGQGQPERIQFDLRKLEAMNGDKIRALDPAGFVARIMPFLQRAGLVADPPTAAQAQLGTAAAPADPDPDLAAARRPACSPSWSARTFAVDPEDAAKARKRSPREC